MFIEPTGFSKYKSSERKTNDANNWRTMPKCNILRQLADMAITNILNIRTNGF